jgi:sulfur-oxidizing protein SoxY
VATTLRLAQSQKVTAVAAMSDGRFVMADANIVVTLSACIDGG